VELEPQCGEGRVFGTKVTSSFGEIQQPLQPDSGCNATQAAEIRHLDGVTRTAAYYTESLVFNGSSLYDKWFGDWSQDNGSNVHNYVKRYLTQQWDLRCNGGDCCD